MLFQKSGKLLWVAVPRRALRLGVRLWLGLALGLALCSVADAQSHDRPRRSQTGLRDLRTNLRARAAARTESQSELRTESRTGWQTGSQSESQTGSPDSQDDSDLRNAIVRRIPPPRGGLDQRDARTAGQPEIRPPVEPPPWSRLLPPEPRRQFHRHLAMGLEQLMVPELSATAHAQWVALEPERAAAWHGLARARVRDTYLAGAESALLAALQRVPRAANTADTANSGFASQPDGGAPSSAFSQANEQLAWVLQRDLGELYMLQERKADAVAALARASALKPNNERVTGLLARARHELDPNTHAMPEARFDPWPAPASPLRARLLLGGAVLLLLFVLRAAIQVLQALRGGGDLVVSISYPEELKGEFSVRVSRQRVPRRRTRGGTEAPGPRVSSQMEHHSVSRETHFRAIRVARYYVSVEGVLRDPNTGAVLTSPYEERSAVISRGNTAQLDFDLSPRECPVDVCVLWDKRPVKDASVTSRGLPQSLRYTRDGEVRLRLPKGTHTIAVGSGDRVAERAVVVKSFQPIKLTIDLAGSEDVIFKGCPPAVTPYIHGDLGAAARALELDGHTQLSHLLQARLHHERGQTAQAAEHFELAGRLLEAAKLHERIRRFGEAAKLFERAKEPHRAGEMYRAGGDLLSAGKAYEQAEEYDSAADCFAEAGDTERQVGALERAGRPYAAAELALTSHDRARAIKLLQQVGSEDANFANACRMLAEAFEHEGHLDMAADRLERLIDAGIQDDLPELQSKLADLLEACDQVEKALSVLTALREIAPTFPNVASRIETLRKRRSQEVAPQPAGAPVPAPTAFHQSDRYEILEEVGRGGMGIVFKARDTRLRRIVALKRLPENLKEHPKAIALFMREAQSAARLNHSNIVTVFDTDQASDGTFFITMELLEGFPLNAILHQRGRLRARDAVRLCLQVATGLQYAHEQGIIHRDIKTANLFFTSDKVVKIMDFGLAKMVEEVRRGTTVIGGTPFYMAPEQAVGGAVDHRADIYAFGVTLYELVTGKVPFPDGDVTYHHRHTPPPDPRCKVPDLPAALVELIASMMAKRVEDRCESAAEVKGRLKQLVF